MTAELPLHLADQFDAATSQVRRAFTELEGLLDVVDYAAEAPSWEQVLAGLHVMCVHIATEGPQPLGVRWNKRSALCLDCDRGAMLLPDIVPEDECERCGTKTEAFHEVLYQIGPALFSSNICVTCHGQIAGGAPALLEDRYPRERP